MSLNTAPLNWSLSGQEAWLNLYHQLVEPVFEHLRARLPAGLSLRIERKAGEDSGVLRWVTPYGKDSTEWLRIGRAEGKLIVLETPAGERIEFAQQVQYKAARKLADLLTRQALLTG